MTNNVAAFSGGKDSTAMVLRLAELGESFTCLFTPTGNELPECIRHFEHIMQLIRRPLVTPPNRSLEEWIAEFRALPNNRQRWCTRLIKIVPAIRYLEAHPGSTLIVGLRADEDARTGLFGDYAHYRYPLREWGWGIDEVWAYLEKRGVCVPARTDCALCYDQRLGEWYRLWRDYPGEFANGEALEERYGYTFRSPSRDTWPAALKDLRAAFESGRRPRNIKQTLFGEEDTDLERCRVCSM